MSNNQLAENGNPPQKGVAGEDTGSEARRAIREMLKKGATIESIAAAANRDAGTINQILRGDIENPPSDLAANVRKAKIIKLDEMLFELQENKSNRVQIAKVGTFNHEVYGKFSIKLSAMEQMRGNFNNNVRRQKLDGVPALPLDYKHAEKDIAAGWIKKLEIDKDENGVKALFADVEWTPRGAQKVRDREFAFISPSIVPVYKDRETGQTFNNVLRGATLTNIPFLRDMSAVNLLSEGRRVAFESLKLSGDKPDINHNTGANMKLSEEFKAMSPKEKEKFLADCGVKPEDKKLSEELESLKKDKEKSEDALKLSEDKIKTLETNLSGSSAAGDKLKLAEGEIGKLKTQVGSLTKTMAEDKKKTEFDQMLSEGKVCEAQRNPFMENDIAGFAKNVQEVKLDESGKGDHGDEAGNAEDKIDKLAEEKIAADKNLDYGDAVSLVLSENPKLAAAVN